jgi:predicted MPP superfamily phosphohydrolase
MIRFLIFYFVAYGGANFYFLVKLTSAFRTPSRVRFVIILAITTLFLSPLIAIKLESFGPDILPELFSSSGYIWMGLLFLFVSMAALIDTVKLTLARTNLKVSAKALFTASAAYSLIIGIYGYHEALNIITEHLTIKSSRIPATVGRVRIVQISDVHIGQIVRESRIKTVIETIKAASPDILVSTGDLVDGHQKHFAGLDHLFLEINPRLGKYAILGNHEHYVGVEQSVEFIKNAGFKLLDNESSEIKGVLAITGVDDSRKEQDRISNAVAEKALLEAVPAGEFRLLLKHRPVVEKTSAGKFDLQLSGHVHKGQIFPFNLLTWLSFPVRTGLTELENGSHLYVSRGTGVWGPPIRFMASPEITVIDLMPAKEINKKN